MISSLLHFLAAAIRFVPISLQWPYDLLASKAILQRYPSAELGTSTKCIRIDTFLQAARWSVRPPNAGNRGERQRVLQPKAAYCLPLLLWRLDDADTKLVAGAPAEARLQTKLTGKTNARFVALPATA